MSVVPSRSYSKLPNPQCPTTCQQGPPALSFSRGEMPEKITCIRRFFRELWAEPGGKPMSLLHPSSSSPCCVRADAPQQLICCDIHLCEQKRDKLKVSPQVRQDCQNRDQVLCIICFLCSFQVLFSTGYVHQDTGATDLHQVLLRWPKPQGSPLPTVPWDHKHPRLNSSRMS